MLKLNLKPIFQARNIDKPYTFLKKNGFSHVTAINVSSGAIGALSFKQIEALCTVLLCEPNDLFTWQPDEGKLYPENMPLHKLKKTGQDINLHAALATMSYQEIKERMQQITER